MELIIAILLWMGVVRPGDVYTQPEFDQLVVSHQPVIQSVLADPVQQQLVWSAVGSNEPDVVIGGGE